MAKPMAAFIISVAFASNDVLSDDALSLLQTRVAKHQVQQAPTLADGSVLEVRGGGTLCAEDEVITFAKCNEAQKRQIIPNTMAHGVIYNARGHGTQPTGCFKLGGNMYFNDEPATVKNGHGTIMPICQVGGGGGRAAEIIAQGMSCQEPTCVQPAGHHKMTWDDSVFVPKLTVGALGSVCEEACGLLTYEQCSKAGDMGLIPGYIVIHETSHQTVGPGHTAGTLPSACSIMSGSSGSSNFNSMDTPSAAFAAPDTAGDAWVTPSGVGGGWNQVAPVCGECTTTTTTPAPQIEDDAAAVGDPHMHTANGEKFDLAKSSLKH